MLNIGTVFEVKEKVTENRTAQAVGSGDLRVLATPAMTALMEKAALMCVKSGLDDKEGTVGISLNIRHIAPTPVGMEIICRATLVQTDSRKLTFSLEAFDEKEKIGEGTHERFIINNEKFQNKCDGKINE